MENHTKLFWNHTNRSSYPSTIPLNRSVRDEAFYGLIIGYAILGVTGALGNLLVCSVVIFNKQMRTTRNMLIVNLAASDLILCLFTMPFSLVQIITKYWPFGTFMCRSVAVLQAVSVFVSTMNITLIALDRYKVIVYATKGNATNSNNDRIFIKVIFIWILSFALSSPLFIFRTVDRHYLNITGLEYVEFCFEEWPIEHGAAVYSICTMIFQYLFPIIAVSFTYIKISMKLRGRFKGKAKNVVSEQQKQKHKREQGRMRRTNYLLVSIALVFALTWLPLNILNIISDLVTFKSSEKFLIVFGCCHMVGMTSACSNPMFYGWFNENFQKEFRKILCRYVQPPSTNEHTRLQDVKPSGSTRVTVM